MKFTAFNLKKELIEILNELGYNEATKVQEVVMPAALRKENLLIKAQTGSGKTHSFLIPILNNVEFNGKLQSLIIVPSRELAKQTYDFIDEIAKFDFFKRLKYKVFFGGKESTKDLKSFENGCEIAITTPGRLNFLLNSNNNLVESLNTIILDEVDMLIDDTFINEMNDIFKKVPGANIQVFSATFSNRSRDFLNDTVKFDLVINDEKDLGTSKTVNHFFINTKHQDRNFLLKKFIEIKNPFLLLVFASSKKEVNRIYSYLSQNRFKCGIISGELEARERRSMLRRIKNDEFQIVVCSDLAARGIDIDNVTDVLNYDLPNNIEYYYHRAGRTGRNFKDGNCYSFYDNDTLNIPTKLLDQGLQVEYLKFSDDKLVQDTPIIKEKVRKKKVDTELEREIKKAKSQAMGKSVKPGYKKKVKRAIDKVKSKHKREIIKNDIKRQRIERYKKESKLNG